MSPFPIIAPIINKPPIVKCSSLLPMFSALTQHGADLRNSEAVSAVSCRLDRRTLVIPLGYTGPRSLERPGSTETVDGVISPVIRRRGYLGKGIFGFCDYDEVLYELKIRFQLQRNDN